MLWKLTGGWQEKMKYAKYHALGNDYIVIHPAEIQDKLSEDMIRLICHRNFGIGSDGILLGPLVSRSCDFGLKIFNPGGSLRVQFGKGFFATLTGPVAKICDGVMTKEMFGRGVQ